MLVAGSFDGVVAKGEDAGGPRDVSILRYHVNGDKLDLDWTKRIKPDGDTSSVFGLGLAADHTGSFFLTGTFSGQLKLPDGRGGKADAALDVYVVKLSSNGQPEWLLGSDDRGEDIGRSVALDKDGTIVLAGSFTDNMSLGGRLESSGRTDVFVAKLRPGSSAVAWSAGIGSRGYDVGRGVAIGPPPAPDPKKPDEKKSGQIAVVGTYTDTVTFAAAYQLKRWSKAIEPNRGGTDGFIAWYSQDGQLTDHLAFGAGGDDAAAAVAIDDDNNTYVTGWFQGKINLGSLELESHGGKPDGFVAKFDDKHKAVWAYRIGGAGPVKVRALALDRARGNVVVAGRYLGKTDFQDAGKDARQSLPGTADKAKEHNRGFVAEYHANGTLAWVGSYGDDDNDVSASAVALNELDHETNEMGLETPVDRGAVAVAYHVGTDEDVRSYGLSWSGHGLVVSYSSRGEPEKRKPLHPLTDGCRDRVRALALSGNTLVATGAFSRTAYKAGKREICVSTSSDLFVVKFDHRKAVAHKTFASDGENDASGLARQTRDTTDENHREEAAHRRDRDHRELPGPAQARRSAPWQHAAQRQLGGRLRPRPGPLGH